jgi:hypothetical protein
MNIMRRLGLFELQNLCGSCKDLLKTPIRHSYLTLQPRNLYVGKRALLSVDEVQEAQENIDGAILVVGQPCHANSQTYRSSGYSYPHVDFRTQFRPDRWPPRELEQQGCMGLDSLFGNLRFPNGAPHIDK